MVSFKEAQNLGFETEFATPFAAARRAYQPVFSRTLRNLVHLNIEESPASLHGSQQSALEYSKIREAFPHTAGRGNLRFKHSEHALAPQPLRLGVVFSGGPAPGGHNVIAGIWDGLKNLGSGHELYGFLGGPQGILDARYIKLDSLKIDSFRNAGGFHLIGTGRTKIESEKDMDLACDTIRKLELDGLVVVGGDDSNTNAAMLAERFLQHRCCIVGVPKTIDADMQNDYVQTSFGFDTASKVYSELISNIARDAVSAKKYYHVIRLMGRSASHITLECALRTQPTIALISEEIANNSWGLLDVARYIGKIVVQRAEAGLHHGVILIPEGLVEFLPDFRALIFDLNRILAEVKPASPLDLKNISSFLAQDCRELWNNLPQKYQNQLLSERDPHGNFVVSNLQVEDLILDAVERWLQSHHSQNPTPKKITFSYQKHFFGYEGRCAAPSNFDANYGYNLGLLSSLLVAKKQNGFLCALQGLEQDATEWQPLAVALSSLLHAEVRKGKTRFVIKKHLVSMESKAFKHFEQKRVQWSERDCFRFEGPIQYFGPKELCDEAPLSMSLNSGKL